MRYFAYLHNVEIGRKLCSFICEKSYEFYEFVRSVPAFGDFGGCSPRRGLERGGRSCGGGGAKGKHVKVFIALA